MVTMRKVQCGSCGAQRQVPATSGLETVACRKCGADIPVAPSRPGDPARRAPRTARPAPRGRRGRGGSRAAQVDEADPSRAAARGKRSSEKTAIIWTSVIGGLLVVGVIGLLASSSSRRPPRATGYGSDRRGSVGEVPGESDTGGASYLPPHRVCREFRYAVIRKDGAAALRYLDVDQYARLHDESPGIGTELEEYALAVGKRLPSWSGELLFDSEQEHSQGPDRVAVEAERNRKVAIVFDLARARSGAPWKIQNFRVVEEEGGGPGEVTTTGGEPPSRPGTGETGPGAGSGPDSGGPSDDPLADLTGTTDEIRRKAEKAARDILSGDPAKVGLALMTSKEIGVRALPILLRHLRDAEVTDRNIGIIMDLMNVIREVAPVGAGEDDRPNPPDPMGGGHADVQRKKEQWLQWFARRRTTFE